MIRPTRHALAAATLVLAAALAACGGGATKKSQSPAPEEARPDLQNPQTAGVATVTGDDISKVGVQRIEEYLNGRVPGLQVYRNQSGEYTIRIRGTQKFGQGSEEPLLVVDGMPVSQGSVNTVLSTIDPREIAKVEVLKDASSTAMYGSRGANGVLVIKTKRTR